MELLIGANRRKWAVFVALITFLLPIADSKGVKVFKQGAGKDAIEVVDETQFKYPGASSFDDEIEKKIDYSDEYDELVPKLPKYEVHQFGKNIGYTRVPIVTRSKPYWSTPMPRTLLEKTWSTPDSLRKRTKPIKTLKSTTPMPRTSPDEELLPPDEEPPKKHHLSATSRQPTNHKLKPSDREEQPDIHVVISNNPKASNFRRITISTTHSPSTTKSHPVWHNPNFIRTKMPLQVESSTSSAEHPKWVPWWKRNQTDNDRKIVVQVTSMLETNEDKKHKSVKHPVKTSEFVGTTGRHIISSTTSDETQVDILVAPNSVAETRSEEKFKPLPRPSSGPWSWHRTWQIGPDGKRVETFTSSGNVPKDRLPKMHEFSLVATSPSPTRGTTMLSSLKPHTVSSKCRVLEAVGDGEAAPDNDPTCKLLYPGYPADDSCKCTFHVNGRDKNGCAIGFLYSCIPTAILIQE